MNRHERFHRDHYHRFRHEFYCSHKYRMRHNDWHRDFHRSHRALKFLRPVFLLLIILLIYLMFKFPINKVLTFLFGVFILSQIVQLVWITHLEKRIFKPISQLHNGVKEIAKGNFDVTINNTTFNEIGFLIDSFNEMAAKLQENEILKREYEENWKMLIANISHDLKTPITSIGGYIDAIHEGVVTSPEKMDQYLQVIRKNTIYINHLIDDLFLFSKLAMHQLDFQMESISIKPFMEDLMAEFSFEFQEKGFDFCYTDDLEENYPVLMDRQRIYQVIHNIIGNSVKYGPAASLGLKTRLYRKEALICLDIQDNGPGIPEDKISKIFDRFYRIDSERTKDLMSTGLGLSIAKELMEAHGGKIQVTSVLGEGSCFTLILPIDNEERI
ncbi:sensor histidine kinase [Desulforamulus aeronauticus]|uniref:histidine kinase n=1 Tax=Desulforamulus aeronauticus DSM 10349 TaxID=1121421 RepID=A0A1M6TD06_9FIRM|nr:HAMP domain-containing sensor histidine kinase [Desulforamulus aeronauticus]SHK54887.1 Signal transduction histidine kinase [Desulforamulus aeronauticus DSM 10349]